MSSDKKNNPTGIRYDKDKVSFIKERENLNTVQKVINFLIDKYWWENRLPIANQNMNNAEIKGNYFAKTEPTKQPIQEKTFQQHMNELPDLMYEEEYRKKAAEIEAATNLTRRQKDLLITNMHQSKL